MDISTKTHRFNSEDRTVEDQWGRPICRVYGPGEGWTEESMQKTAGLIVAVLTEQAKDEAAARKEVG